MKNMPSIGFACRQSNFIFNTIASAIIGLCGVAFSVSANGSIMGTLEGEASVNQGKLSYELPLTLPAGVADHTPELSFHYNASGGNGEVGVGFALNGPSTISRCAASKRVDGFVGAITGTASDTYCLDGQRLVPLPGSNGTYYVTSLNQHNRIVANGNSTGGPSAWEVRLPNGERLVYANTSASIDTMANGAALRWRLTDRYDRNDNRIQYHYAKVSNRSRLDKITYAHHEVTFAYTSRPDTLSLYQQGRNQILNQRLSSIQISTNSQASFNYRLGYENSLGFSRLNDIRRCDSNGASSCQRPTTFSWQADEAFPNPGPGNDLPELNDLPADSLRQARDLIAFGSVPDDFLTYRFADVNRDGIRDLCYTDKQGLHCGLGSQGSTPSAFSLWSSAPADERWHKWGAFQTLAMVDLNGDRFPDFCLRDNKGLYCALNQKGSGSNSFANATYWFEPENPAHASQGQFVDINQDQKADWCGFQDDGVLCQLSNGSIFSGTYQPVTGIDYLVEAPQSDDDVNNKNPATARFMDISGDGAQDVCGFYSDGLKCQLNKGVNSNNQFTFGAQQTMSTELTQSYMQQEGVTDTLRFGDLNGDGLSDLCLRDNLNLRCALNKGNGFTSLTTWLTLPDTYKVADWNTNTTKVDSPHDGTLSLVDWNQDGKVDVCVAQMDNQYQCALNTSHASATGFSALQKVADAVASPYHMEVSPIEYGTTSYWFRNKKTVTSLGQVEPMRHYPLQWADANSDGALDVCHRGADGISCHLGNNVRYHRLTGVVSGLGKVTNIAYGRLNNASIYVTQSTSDSNLVPYTPAMTVVSRLSQSNPAGTLNHTDYTYAGIFYDLENTRRTPFSQIMAKQNAFNRKDIHDYHVSGELRGRLQQKRTYTANVLTQNTEQTYELVIQQAKDNNKPLIQRVRTTQIKRQQFDLNGADLGEQTTKNTTFDGYDRITGQTVTTSGNVDHTQTTTTEYQHITDNKWILGLSTKITLKTGGESRIQANTYDGKGNRLTNTIQPGDSLSSTTNNTYDSVGNITQQSIIAGDKTRTQSWTYAANNMDVLSHTNAAGHIQSWQYHSTCALPAKHTDANNLITTYAYDSLCRQTQEVTPQGVILTRAYAFQQGGSALGNRDNSVYGITQTQTEAPTTTSYYNAFGNVVRTKTMGFGNQWVYQDSEYDARGVKVKATAPYFAGTYAGANARWTAFTYDDLLRETRTQRPGPDNATETTQTSYNGLTQTKTDALGIARKTTTNGLGQITKIIEGNDKSTINYTYDGWGQLTKSDANGTVISHQYDVLGNKTQTADPSLGTWKFTYNGFGEITKQTDAKEQATTFTYDKLGRLTTRADSSGTSTFTYDTKQKGKLSSTKATGAMGDSETQITYNEKGLPSKVDKTIAGEVFTTSTAYDSVGRPSQVDLPDGIRYYNTYANGQLNSIEVPKKQIWDYNFLAIEQGLEDAANNIKRLTALIEEKEAEELRLVNEARRYYDAANYWEGQKSSLQNSANYLRDYARRLESIANYYRGVVSSYRSAASYYYRAYGNRYFSLIRTRGYYLFRHSQDVGCARRGRSGGCRQRAYRHYYFGVSHWWANILGSSYFRHGIRPHDFYSRIANHYQGYVNHYQHYSNVYNNVANSYQSQANAAQNNANYYRNLGNERVAKARELTAELAQYRDELVTESQRQASLQAQWEAYQNDGDTITVWTASNRDAAGRLTALLHGNGLTTHQTHDPYTGRLQSIKTGSDLAKESTWVRHLSYAYDANNSVTRRQDHKNGITETYAYDQMDRLIGHTLNNTHGQKITSYEYDTRGNMTNKSDTGTMAYDEDNQLTTLTKPNSQQVSYLYDHNGNQTRGLGHTTTWNAFNKVSQISQNGHTSQYQYGADQQRTKQVETRRDGSSRTTQYVSDSYERMVETRANGDKLVQGTHTFFADGQAVTIHVRTTLNGNKNADQFRYLHRDPLNSIDTITDANASVQERLSYGPFGLRRQANGEPLSDLTRNPSALSNRGYTNHEHQDQLTLIDMNARMYDPITGRFLSPDTMVPWPTYAMSHNRYTYVNNNPLKYYDPTGHYNACVGDDCDSDDEDWTDPDIWDDSITDDNGGDDNGEDSSSSGEVGEGASPSNSEIYTLAQQYWLYGLGTTSPSTPTYVPPNNLTIDKDGNPINGLENVLGPNSQMSKNPDGTWQARRNTANRAFGLSESTVSHGCSAAAVNICSFIGALSGKGGSEVVQSVDSGYGKFSDIVKDTKYATPAIWDALVYVTSFSDRFVNLQSGVCSNECDSEYFSLDREE